jgi:glycosyltransferase involved in cell wall biosynthesis
LTQPPPGPPDDEGVALAIPCYNEAAALPAVLAEWRGRLPRAEIVVFDNNSTDGTAEIARREGVAVVLVPEQGKGHVVRAILARLADRRAVILIDGDGTYPASAVGPLLGAVLHGGADMAVGARKPVAEPGAMSPVRALGNLVIGLAFRLLIGPATNDLLSGYRVFSPRFCRLVRPRSAGFEIETELASEAVALGLPTAEFPVPYLPRIAGTASKLRAFRDGLRILRMILAQSARHRPWRLFGPPAVLLLLAGIIARSIWLGVVGAGASLLLLTLAIRQRRARATDGDR